MLLSDIWLWSKAVQQQTMNLNKDVILVQVGGGSISRLFEFGAKMREVADMSLSAHGIKKVNVRDEIHKISSWW